MNPSSAQPRTTPRKLAIALLLGICIAFVTAALAPASQAATQSGVPQATTSAVAASHDLRDARDRRHADRRALASCIRRRQPHCTASRRRSLRHADSRVKQARQLIARIALRDRSGATPGRRPAGRRGTPTHASTPRPTKPSKSRSNEAVRLPDSGVEAASTDFATEPGAPIELGLVPASMSSSEPEAIGQLGARTVRMEFEIDEPAYKLAPVVEEYAKQGIRIMPLAGFEGTLPTVAEAQNLASWATTFGPGGSFWQGKSYSPSVAITNIEFGNETSFYYQYKSNSDAAMAERAQTYALRFQSAYEAIHEVNPGVSLLAQGDEGNAGPAWVENMFKAVPDLGQIVGGWTIHPYGPTWQPRIEELIAQTQAAGAPSSVPIYLTEWGIASDNGRCLAENYGWNPCMTYSEAASALTSSIASMRTVFGGRVRGLYLYQAHDLAPSEGSENFSYYFGARQYDGAPKGAYTTAVEDLFAEGA
ncbi:MAG TPA: hypothetical protein VGF95_06600 [Solirubrobacteraceae bacterium]|jgi:hypothetical protein